MSLTEDHSSHHGDPEFEPENAKRRLWDGEFDPGASIVLGQFFLDPENARDGLRVGHQPEEISDDLVAATQATTRALLVNKVLAFLGNHGELPLTHSLAELRSVIESLPETSRLFARKAEFLSTLDEIDALIGDFTFEHFQPGQIPLTPKHAETLQRLGVVSFEKIQSLLTAIQQYGALMNYGESLESPSFTLMDFCDSLRSGEFLDEFVQKLRNTNRLPIAKVLEYLRDDIVPALTVVFSEAAQKHNVDIRSISAVYDFIPLVLEDLLEDAKTERDAKKRKKKELLVAAVHCILKEMPDIDATPIPEEDDLDEDGVGKRWVFDADEEGEQEDSTLDHGFEEGDPDQWRGDDENKDEEDEGLVA